MGNGEWVMGNGESVIGNREVLTVMKVFSEMDCFLNAKSHKPEIPNITSIFRF